MEIWTLPPHSLRDTIGKKLNAIVGKIEMKQILLLFVILVTLSACTFRKLAYSWADSYFLMQIDSSFDLTSAQESEARSHVKRLLDWHRTHQLPQYITFVSEVSDRTQRSLTHADIDWAYSEVVRLGTEMAKQASIPAGPFLASLENKQFENLAKNNGKRNKKRFERYFSGPEKFIEHRDKSTRKHVKEWLGSINEKQSEIVKSYAADAWSFEKLRYENALNNQNDFLKTLKRQQTIEIQSRIANTFLFPQSFQPETYRVAYQENRSRISQLVLDLQRFASVEQIRYFHKKLKELRQDFLEMQKTQFL